MQFYNPKMECADREIMTGLQAERLTDLVKRVYNNVPFYKEKIDKTGIEINKFNGFTDLAKLPFTTKKDLRDNYPYQLFAVPKEKIVRLHASSGTTGKPTVVGYTKKDLNTWGEIGARALVSAGATPKSVVQIAYGYGLFTGGMGLNLGSETLGATTIPASTGNTQRQLLLMEDLGTDVICCTPSYAIVIAEQLEKDGILVPNLNLRSGIFGAEPWDKKVRADIERRLNLTAYDIYGLSEIMGPGVAIECSAHKGLHIQEDHFIAEIIDPKTGENLPDGEEGELVVTTLTKEALPLLRYRTGDLTSIIHDKCECGRTTARIMPIRARTDDMLIVRGVNVFPSQIATVLNAHNELSPHWKILIHKEGALDYMKVVAERNPGALFDMVNLTKIITKELADALYIACAFEIIEPNTLERFDGKTKRSQDMR